MKLVGTGPGPLGLLTEYLALAAARAMGLRVPRATLLYLRPGFPWTIGTDEFDGIVQRSYGWNLGVSFVPDARPAAAEEVLRGPPAFLRALEQVDRLVGNMDRSAGNPNILVASAGLVAIDFDACLFLRRAAGGIVPAAFDLPEDHLLHGAALPGPGIALDAEVLVQGLDEAPAEWLSSVPIGRDGLAANLGRYVAAWNSSIEDDRASD